MAVDTVFTPTGTGAVTRSISAEILDRMPLVTWYGAVADSVGSGSGTDNTAAFQAALDNNPRASSVGVPPGVLSTGGVTQFYRITSTIALGHAQMLCGLTPVPNKLSGAFYVPTIP